MARKSWYEIFKQEQRIKRALANRPNAHNDPVVLQRWRRVDRAGTRYINNIKSMSSYKKLEDKSFLMASERRYSRNTYMGISNG